MVLQIIQHIGALPVPEDGDSIKAVQSPRIRRQSSELSALRPKRQDKPQQVAPGSVEGILTLQLSHLNVVHTFRAVTVPVQVAPLTEYLSFHIIVMTCKYLATSAALLGGIMPLCHPWVSIIQSRCQALPADSF